MSDEGKIRFAVAGLGQMGKRHAAILGAHPECVVTSACDTKKGVEPRTDDAIQNIPVFASLEALLASDTPFEVLCITTPNGWHGQQALLALEAGKHVVIEKPMALSRAGCEKIIAASQRYSRQVFCVMQNRFSAAAAWLKQLISDGTLGNLYMVQVNCFWNRDERYYKPGGWHGTAMDGGVLFTQFSHFIDGLYWFFGDITNIQSRFANCNHPGLAGFDDSGSVHFDFVKGGMGNLNFTTACYETNLGSDITVIAEKGTVRIGGQYMNHVEYCHIKDYHLPEAFMQVSEPMDPGYNHRIFFNNVVDALKGRASAHINAHEGLMTVDIIKRIMQAGPTVIAKR